MTVTTMKIILYANDTTIVMHLNHIPRVGDQITDDRGRVYLIKQVRWHYSVYNSTYITMMADEVIE